MHLVLALSVGTIVGNGLGLKQAGEVAAYDLEFLLRLGWSAALLLWVWSLHAGLLIPLDNVWARLLRGPSWLLQMRPWPRCGALTTAARGLSKLAGLFVQLSLSLFDLCNSSGPRLLVFLGKCPASLTIAASRTPEASIVARKDSWRSTAR